MSFIDNERIFSLAPANVVSILTALREQYGVLFQDGKSEVLTLAAHWDDSLKTRKRAASLSSGTIRPIYLTNSKVAFIALWSSSLMQEFDENGIEGVEEISFEQLLGFMPPRPVGPDD